MAKVNLNNYQNQNIINNPTAIFVASANPSVAGNDTGTSISTDGITWLTVRTITNGGQNIYNYASSNTTLVGVGSYANSVYSTDGIAWATAAMPALMTWTDITYANGIFASISKTTGNAAATMAASSTDGVTWTTRTLPASATWQAITYGNGLFVALSGSTTAASSTDGITWALRTMPTSTSWYSVAYGNGVFAAISQTSGTTAATSTDGITWTLRTLPSSVSLVKIIYANNIFVGTGFNSTAAVSSTDGITWTIRTLPAVSTWSTIAYGNGIFLTTGSGTTAASSTDGITWTLRTTLLKGQYVSYFKPVVSESSLTSLSSYYASSIISSNSATVVDTTSLSKFTTMEYTLSIMQGTKVRSSKVFVQTNGTSVDFSEYGIMSTGGTINGVTVSVYLLDSYALLQVQVIDAGTTNATVKFSKVVI